uniref:Uncharacterized protein n=1 Tax=Gallus gallus TaxID=9031 RepID=A0A8V0XIT6_CHICK
MWSGRPPVGSSWCHCDSSGLDLKQRRQKCYLYSTMKLNDSRSMRETLHHRHVLNLQHHGAYVAFMSFVYMLCSSVKIMNLGLLGTIKVQLQPFPERLLPAEPSWRHAMTFPSIT